MLRLLVAVLATAAERRLTHFNPQNVANTAWAFAAGDNTLHLLLYMYVYLFVFIFYFFVILRLAYHYTGGEAAKRPSP